MTKEFREEYGSITLRGRCREALDPIEKGGEGWTMQELRNSFRNKYTKGQIEKFIREHIDNNNLMKELRKRFPKKFPIDIHSLIIKNQKEIKKSWAHTDKKSQMNRNKNRPRRGYFNPLY